MKTFCYIRLTCFFCLVAFHKSPSQELFPLPSERNMIGASVQSLTVGNGLPQGLVTGIVQDQQGFIWMGTKGGLVRYDGYEMKIFNNDPADTQTLASDIILSLYIDRQNNIWITYPGKTLDIFNPVTQSVRHISPKSTLGWLLPNIWSLYFNIFEDSRRRYWIISPGLEKLQFFTRTHKTPTHIAIPKNERVIALQEDEKKEMWICTDKSLYKLYGTQLKKVVDLPDGIAYKSKQVTTLVQDRKGRWILGNTGCVEVFNPRNHRWAIVPTPFPGQVTRFLEKTPDGKIYLNAGSMVFRLNDDLTFTELWTNPNTPGKIKSFLVDRSNVLWLGTNTFGARMLNLSSRGFHSYPYQYGFIFDVLNTLHFPIQEIAYQNRGVSYFARSATDQKGNLWLIHINRPTTQDMLPDGTLSVFRLKDHKSAVVPVKTHYSEWRQITFDDQNQCWAIVTDKDSLQCHLVKVDLAAGRVTPVIPLAYPPDKVAWLTTFHRKLCIVYTKALQLFDPQTKKSRLYKREIKFGNAPLFMATPDPQNDSILWIAGSGNGLMRFNTVNEKVKAFTQAEGIPSNTVYAVIPDKHGYLWCSSNKGIFRFNPADYHVLSFTKKDGLQGNEFNRYHFLKTPDGKIFFGGTLGWTGFYPDSIRIDSYRPSTIITNILVNNQPLIQYPQWKDSIISTMKALTLTYDQNFLTFFFAGLEFNQTGTLPYRYQLMDIDKSWVKGGTENTAHYTNLPPGDYTFKVNAGNTAGIWSDSVKTMEIVILPPWWKTWWAYVIYALLILTVIYSVYRYRSNRLHWQHQVILEQKEAEQLRKMDEMKSRFFSNITHEFRTPLSLIIAPLEQINKEEKIATAFKKKISGVQRNARQLLRLVNQLLDMSKMEAGNMEISLSRGDLALFIQNIIKNFDAQASVKNIELHFNSPLKDEYNFDPDKWQKIASNLVSNAIKFTPEGGHIHVQITAHNPQSFDRLRATPTTRLRYGFGGQADKILLEVKDSGIGIPADKLPHIFNRFYQVDDSLTKSYSGTGIGLALTRELTELMGGAIEVESPPAEQKGKQDKGAIFRVTIPVEKALNTDIPALESLKPLFASQPQTTGSEEQITNADKNIPSILIVEDNKELNKFIAGMLGKNYRVMQAYHGKEAWQIAKEYLPDVILSDIMMPKMDGYALCERIKQSVVTNHIALILLSAKSSHESMIKGLENYADYYMTKPFHIDELQLRIHNIITGQQKLRYYYNRQLANPDELFNAENIKSSFLKKLYASIDENLDNTGLDVGKLAETMAMSRRNLNRKLAMLVNLSAHEVIKQYRLKKAGILLKNKHSVTETAYRTGFNTPSYFSSSFKAFYGVSPSEFI